jgi:hypothetical protein
MHRHRRLFASLPCIVAVLAFGLASCTTYSTSSSSDDSGPDLIHDRGAAQNAVDDMVKAVGADPAQVTLVYLYDEYANMDAQDPKIPDHINSFNWRDDTVDPASPVHLSGPIEDTYADLFPTSAVPWRDIPSLARRAEQRLAHAEPTRVEEPHANNVYVQRSSSLDGSVVLRFTIEGPRRSGSVEMTASGKILTATVD